MIAAIGGHHVRQTLDRSNARNDQLSLALPYTSGVAGDGDANTLTGLVEALDSEKPALQIGQMTMPRLNLGGRRFHRTGR